MVELLYREGFGNERFFISNIQYINIPFDIIYLEIK
jgi:hypothetical protein